MAEKKQCQPLMDYDYVMSILNEISIFAGLSDKQLPEFFKLLNKLTFETDEIIFNQGEQPDYIYVVEKGRVKIIVNEGNTDYELIVFEQGQCFGEASVIGIQPHKGTAIATEHTELIVLSRQALMSIYKNDKDMFSILILNIAREACRRIHSTEDILLHYTQKTHGQ